MATRVRSFCKINLGLAVGPARADGFHSLATCYQTLALHEHVTVSARRAAATRITLEADRAGVPSTATGDAERNTAYRMVAGALERMGAQAEVRIEIAKRLPVQGGMGAGSANAAATLLGLERELGEALSGPERLRLAAEVGSDVPLFLLGGTVLGTGRGEQVAPLPDDGRPLPVVVAVPEVGVSTGAAFAALDARVQAGGLTADSLQARLRKLSHVLVSAWTPTGASLLATGIADCDSPVPAGGEGFKAENGDLAENPLLALVHAGVENDFESVAFGQHPSLLNIKRALEGSLEHGDSRSLYAALSGSGSSLFGIYGSTEAAHAAQQRVQSCGTRALVTQTLPRREYWQRMFT